MSTTSHSKKGGPATAKTPTSAREILTQRRPFFAFGWHALVLFSIATLPDELRFNAAVTDYLVNICKTSEPVIPDPPKAQGVSKRPSMSLIPKGRVYVGQADMARILDLLDRAGLITRTRTRVRNDDGKLTHRVYLSLTDAGVREVRTLMRQVRAFERTLLRERALDERFMEGGIALNKTKAGRTARAMWRKAVLSAQRGTGEGST